MTRAQDAKKARRIKSRKRVSHAVNHSGNRKSYSVQHTCTAKRQANRSRPCAATTCIWHSRSWKLGENYWRRGRDSNPRYPSGYAGFQEQRGRMLVRVFLHLACL